MHFLVTNFAILCLIASTRTRMFNATNISKISKRYVHGTKDLATEATKKSRGIILVKKSLFSPLSSGLSFRPPQITAEEDNSGWRLVSVDKDKKHSKWRIVAKQSGAQSDDTNTEWNIVVQRNINVKEKNEDSTSNPEISKNVEDGNIVWQIKQIKQGGADDGNIIWQTGSEKDGKPNNEWKIRKTRDEGVNNFQKSAHPVNQIKGRGSGEKATWKGSYEDGRILWSGNKFNVRESSNGNNGNASNNKQDDDDDEENIDNEINPRLTNKAQGKSTGNWNNYNSIDNESDEENDNTATEKSNNGNNNWQLRNNPKEMGSPNKDFNAWKGMVISTTNGKNGNYNNDYRVSTDESNMSNMDPKVPSKTNNKSDDKFDQPNAWQNSDDNYEEDNENSMNEIKNNRPNNKKNDEEVWKVVGKIIRAIHNEYQGDNDETSGGRYNGKYMTIKDDGQRNENGNKQRKSRYMNNNVYSNNNIGYQGNQGFNKYANGWNANPGYSPKSNTQWQMVPTYGGRYGMPGWMLVPTNGSPRTRNGRDNIMNQMRNSNNAAYNPWNPDVPRNAYNMENAMKQWNSNRFNPKDQDKVKKPNIPSPRSVILAKEVIVIDYDSLSKENKMALQNGRGIKRGDFNNAYPIQNLVLYDMSGTERIVRILPESNSRHKRTKGTLRNSEIWSPSVS